jgi:hypothetical protein
LIFLTITLQSDRIPTLQSATARSQCLFTLGSHCVTKFLEVLEQLVAVVKDFKFGNQTRGFEGGNGFLLVTLRGLQNLHLYPHSRKLAKARDHTQSRAFVGNQLDSPVAKDRAATIRP